jgi:hypothetical protein
VRLLFKELSRLRRKRIFHPFGAGFRAEFRPAGESVGALVLERESEPLVRLSRSVGLPELLPDPCGLAFRFPDAYGPGEHQDVLLVSSSLARGARHTLLPSRGFGDRPYSSVLPYRLRGETTMLGARALAAPPGPKLADLRGRERGGLEFELLLASVTGPWRPVGRLALGMRLAAEQTERLDLDPTNTGGGLELAGLLNDLRGPSYRGSQEGRAEAYSRNG